MVRKTLDPENDFAWDGANEAEPDAYDSPQDSPHLEDALMEDDDTGLWPDDGEPPASESGGIFPDGRR